MRKLNSIRFEGFQFHDAHGYLTHLTLAAHNFNDCFHENTAQIFAVNLETGFFKKKKTRLIYGAEKTVACQALWNPGNWEEKEWILDTFWRKYNMKENAERPEPFQFEN